jgi:protein-tyrosine phosphatase
VVFSVPGVFNLRDLGGYTTPEGSVRRGVLLRSSALLELGPGGHEALTGLGLQTAIDMREPWEHERFPVDLTGTGIELIEQPLLGVKLGKEHYELTRFNTWLIDERPGELSRMFETLARDDLGPTVFFCTSGKDRTGMISALTLSVLGVSDADAAADYALTEKLMPEEHIDQFLEDNLDNGISEETTRAGFASPIEVMEAALEHLRGEYGGAVGYLLDAGLPAAALESFRARMIVT